MNPYGMFNSTEPGDMPISGLAYMMFMQNGQPGYYMLYSSLLNSDLSEDEHFKQKGDRTLE